jgi:hypothetical protein
MTESIKIEVALKHTKQWLPRLRLGVLLMRFACFVGGFGGVDIVPAGPRGHYLTDYEGADGGVFAGPDVKADSWEEAEALVAQLEQNYPGIRVVDGTRRHG